MKRRAIYIFLPLIAVLLTTIQAAPFMPDISLPSDQGGASSYNQGDASSFNQRDGSSFNPINVSHIKHVMPGLPNPAATYCVNHGGSLRNVETPEGTVGYCDLPDGTTCEERAFYNGECGSSNNPNPTTNPTPTPKSTCDNKILIQGKVTSIDQYREFTINVDKVLQGYGLDGVAGFKLVPGVTVETTPVASSSVSINVGDCVEVSGKWCTTDSPPIYLGDTGTYVEKITCSSSTAPSVNPKSKSCVQSGGSVVTKMCCKSISDFPNTCVIGACGCSPDNSKEITVCDCGEGKCFDGISCVDIQNPTSTCRGKILSICASPGPEYSGPQMITADAVVENDGYGEADFTVELILTDEDGKQLPTSAKWKHISTSPNTQKFTSASALQVRLNQNDKIGTYSVTTRLYCGRAAIGTPIQEITLPGRFTYDGYKVSGGKTGVPQDACNQDGNNNNDAGWGKDAVWRRGLIV